MILYRVIPKDNEDISNTPWIGINSFNYDDEDYLHFFILPENVQILQYRKYKINNIDSLIIRCDIPYNLIEFGIGLYNWYYNYKLVPFLEARIKRKYFKQEFIIYFKDICFIVYINKQLLNI